VDGVVALRRDGCLAVAIDPLDGSGGIDANASLGSIFSILPADEATDPFSQAGFDQLAAGLFLYGPQTALVLTVGQGTDAYVLDRRSNEFVLTHPRLNVPRTRHEFAVNASNYRHWEQPVRAYVDDCLSGRTGPLHADFNMRWMGCLAAEAYRILLRGGLYLYPCDARSGYEAGRLRLLYEANPIALLLEQAGGAATDGQFRILEMAPRTLHQRTGLVFGSRDMVDLVGAYHAGAMSAGARSPLFGRRGLFRV
jgi:fructose-1,6-bisphosphatase I